MISIKNFLSGRFTKNTLPSFFGMLFLFSLFFPIRKVFITPEAYLTRDFSDFTSFSLYLSDILVFFLFVCLIISERRDFIYFLLNKAKIQILIILIAVIGIFLSNYTSLNIYIILRLSLYSIVAYGTLVFSFSKCQNTSYLSKNLLNFVVFLGISESFIALYQFLSQKALGLGFFGEMPINPLIKGFSKIIVSGETLVRGYGTFPHPNVLGLVLVFCAGICFYKLIDNISIKSRLFYAFSLFSLCIGLTVSFSRLSWAGILLFVLGISIGSVNIKKFSSKAIFLSLLFFTFCVFVNLILFRDAVLARSNFSDSSYTERTFYNSTAIKMIKNNPLFGVGAGESVLHMEQYAKKTLNPWEKQPPHNLFLVLSSELGLIAGILMLYFILEKIWHFFKRAFKDKTKTDLIVCVLLLVLFFLSNFDHYFYTLNQAQILFWGVLAFAEAMKNSASEI